MFIYSIVKAKAEENNKCVLKEILNWNIHVCSENNFPTAAGLASSAAGYACFVYTLASLYNLENEEISSIARQGSGSACRSVYGGFVRWHKGSLNDGTDSIAKQIVPHNHWSEMRILILVVNDERKKTSSTGGMSRSVKTSKLLKERVNHCVPERTDKIIEAINMKNFAEFAEITMRDSNQFHAICLDTYPPCVYMNDTSHAIVDFIHRFNDAYNEIKVAYTFDAGPNACLYLLEKDVTKLLKLLNRCFPNDHKHDVEYIKGIPVDFDNTHIEEEIIQKFNYHNQKNLLKYIIHTKVGDGPKKLDDSESLLNESGYPKAL